MSHMRHKDGLRWHHIRLESQSDEPRKPPQNQQLSLPWRLFLYALDDYANQRQLIKSASPFFSALNRDRLKSESYRHDQSPTQLL